MNPRRAGVGQPRAMARQAPQGPAQVDSGGPGPFQIGGLLAHCLEEGLPVQMQLVAQGENQAVGPGDAYGRRAPHLEALDGIPHLFHGALPFFDHFRGQPGLIEQIEFPILPAQSLGDALGQRRHRRGRFRMLTGPGRG